MTDALVPRARPESSRSAAVGRLFVLELSGGRIHSMNPDGSDRKVIVTGCRSAGRHRGRCRGGPHLLDQHGHQSRTNDGSIERADLDGSNRKIIVPRRRHLHAQADPAR